MIPDELFKRRPRHNNTPESTLLILANFIVICLATSLFTTKTHINWFFWVVVGVLAIYNFFTIRRNRDEFENKFVQISYVVSTLVLVGLFFLLKGRT
jgi:nicotinamide riboside transporter PnuC